MGQHRSPDIGIEQDVSPPLFLPEADYGQEVRAMQAVLAQLRSLTSNLEGLLFNLQVYSHRVPDQPKPTPRVILEEGDIVEKPPERLVKGFVGLCKGRESDVHPITEGS